jgi:3-methyladenine DNA glycosylase Tag
MRTALSAPLFLFGLTFKVKLRKTHQFEQAFAHNEVSNLLVKPFEKRRPSLKAFANQEG